MNELAHQLLLIAVEAGFAAGVLLALFSVRATVGLAPIYTTVGVFYYVATLLAPAVLVRVAPGFLMSPGSVALFPASLFTVLLIYIREDAKEARNMIYALLTANVSASVLGLIVAQHLGGPLAVNPLAISPELFVQSPRIFIVGTLALFADTILIILAYEAVSRVLRPFFLRAWASLAAVLVLDTLLFVTGSFVEHPAYGQILLAGIVGKAASAMIYAGALALYLPTAASRRATAREGERPHLGDLFGVLTYRQRYEALRAQATRDPLTGVHNRGFFDEVLQNQVASSGRTGMPLTVMLVDVDHFKAINDAHGHAEGDRALQVIARALSGAARASDVVCRYGGEEFCLILPATALRRAEQLARRIREDVPAACGRAGIAGGRRITVTIGLAASPGDGTGALELLRVADSRMYRGKDAGRDRVEAA